MFQFKIIDIDRTWEISEEEFAEHFTKEQLAQMKRSARFNALNDVDHFGYVDFIDLRVIYFF